MAFTRNRPTASELLSDSQGLIRDNFNSSDDSFGIDHFKFSDSTAANGAHKQAQIKNQVTINGVIPVGLIGNGYETIYSSATAGAGELWFVRGASATGIQLTGPGVPTASTNGFTFLPGGILLQWGEDTLPSSSTVTFPIAFPNNAFNVILTLNGSGTNSSSRVSLVVKSGSITLTQFQYQLNLVSISASSVRWLAIGN